MMRNYVLECYLTKAAKNSDGVTSWEELDKKTNGLASVYTFIGLFLNDQIYAYMVEIQEELKKKNKFKHSVKYLFNKMKTEMQNYNKNMFRITKGLEEYYADVTIDMEEHIKPSIENYKNVIKEVVENNGIDEERSNIIAQLVTINVLCQATRITINEFQERIVHVYGLVNNPAKILDMRSIEKYSDSLNKLISGKIRINFTELEKVREAFDNFTNTLLDTDSWSNLIVEE